jgi:hypothetical protein
MEQQNSNSSKDLLQQVEKKLPNQIKRLAKNLSGNLEIAFSVV